MQRESGRTLHNLLHSVRESKAKTNHIRRDTEAIVSANRRAQAIVNDKSIDTDSRKIISYTLLIDDPWLPELVRSVDAGENIAESFDYSRAAAVVEDISREKTCNEEKIEELAGIICGANDRCAAALVVLMRTLEKSAHAKLLVNKAKHFVFNRRAEANLLGMVDTTLGGRLVLCAITADPNSRTETAYCRREILFAFARRMTSNGVQCLSSTG